VIWGREDYFAVGGIVYGFTIGYFGPLAPYEGKGAGLKTRTYV